MMDNLFREAQILLPSLRRNMIIASYAGIRSKLVPRGEANYGYFVIEESRKVENLINLAGIESPGLTASMPVAEMVAGIVKTKRTLRENTAFKAEYHGQPVFASLDDGTQDDLIRKDADYGEVVCRCKNITRAEVLRALRNPLGVKTIASVKNRVHATMGRCQGGYCLAKITDIILDEFGLTPECIAYRQYGDMPFTGRVK
jgi:glycerol-3-phosphate dehydrogenase